MKGITNKNKSLQKITHFPKIQNKNSDHWRVSGQHRYKRNLILLKVWLLSKRLRNNRYKKLILKLQMRQLRQSLKFLNLKHWMKTIKIDSFRKALFIKDLLYIKIHKIFNFCLYSRSFWATHSSKLKNQKRARRKRNDFFSYFPK